MYDDLFQLDDEFGNSVLRAKERSAKSYFAWFEEMFACHQPKPGAILIIDTRLEPRVSLSRAVSNSRKMGVSVGASECEMGINFLNLKSQDWRLENLVSCVYKSCVSS